MEYAHLDGIGNVIAVSNSAGVEIESHDYPPFGEEWWQRRCGSVKADSRAGSRGRSGRGDGADHWARHCVEGRPIHDGGPSVTIPANLANPQRWNRYPMA